MKMPREFYIPKRATKVADKATDAVCYFATFQQRQTGRTLYHLVGFAGKARKPSINYTIRNDRELERTIREFFEGRKQHADYVAKRTGERKAESETFAASVEVGDIFHYSFGYDETHHVFYEVVEVKGRHAVVRKIRQAAEDLGYDNRHRCAPQSGEFCGPPVRVLLQDGLIKVDRHYHARKWNTRRVAGVPVGPSYVGGGMH